MDQLLQNLREAHAVAMQRGIGPTLYSRSADEIAALRKLLHRVLIDDDHNVDCATNLNHELTHEIALALGCACGNKLAYAANCPIHDLGGFIKPLPTE